MKKFFPKYLANQKPYDPAKLNELPMYTTGGRPGWTWLGDFIGRTMTAYQTVKHWITWKLSAPPPSKRIQEDEQGNAIGDVKIPAPQFAKHKNIFKLRLVVENLYNGFRYWFFRTGVELHNVPEEIVNIYEPLKKVFQLGEIIANHDTKKNPLSESQLAQIIDFLDSVQREIYLNYPVPPAPTSGGVGMGFGGSGNGTPQPQSGDGNRPIEKDDPFAGIPRMRDEKKKQNDGQPPNLFALIIQAANYLIKIVNEDQRALRKLNQPKRKPVRSRKQTTSPGNSEHFDTLDEDEASGAQDERILRTRRKLREMREREEADSQREVEAENHERRRE